MEDVWSGVLHDCLCRQRLADVTVGDRAARRLYPRAEHGVGCDADQEPGRFGLFKECESTRAVDTDRLLRPHVLACRDCPAGDFGVGGGNGEIDDDLDVRMCQDVVAEAPLWHVVLLGLSLRALLVEITQDHDAYVGETGQVLQVCVADHPVPMKPTPTGPDAAIT